MNETIRTSELILDEAYQVRKHTGEMRHHIQNLKQKYRDGARFPPVTVDVKNRVIDGFHRTIAYRELGVVNTKIERVDLNKHEAVRLALSNNNQQGICLNRMDGVLAVWSLIYEEPERFESMSINDLKNEFGGVISRPSAQRLKGYMKEMLSAPEYERGAFEQWQSIDRTGGLREMTDSEKVALEFRSVLKSSSKQEQKALVRLATGLEGYPLIDTDIDIPEFLETTEEEMDSRLVFDDEEMY